MTARHRWTPAQEQRLRELYTDTPADRIAAELGLPVADARERVDAWRAARSKTHNAELSGPQRPARKDEE